jgi:hypothetical protein
MITEEIAEIVLKVKKLHQRFQILEGGAEERFRNLRVETGPCDRDAGYLWWEVPGLSSPIISRL